MSANFYSVLGLDRDDQLISTEEFEKRTSVKRAMRYRKWDRFCPYFDPTFPRPIKIGPRSNRFSLKATNEWVGQSIRQGTQFKVDPIDQQNEKRTRILIKSTEVSAS